jgi:Rrf2 family protein
MKLSAQEEYGLRCLLQVALLERNGPAQIAEIANREGLSHEYTAKLMRVLRQADLVVSVRGAGGGYRLARPADEITVQHAIEALDGPLFHGGFCADHRGKQVRCVHSTGCAIRGLWRWVGSALEVVLGRITLADLARGEAFVDAALPELPADLASEEASA